jgi:hypothetical protein
MSIVTGCVCSGRRMAADHLDVLRPQLDRYLGSPHMPGTLNVVLHSPVNLDLEHAAIVVAKRAFWPIRFNSVDVLAYRWQRCPLHVVEIVSHLPLRKHFGLQDRAQVTLDMSGVVTATPLSSKLCWWLVWRGRERLFYASDNYQRRMRKRARWLTRRAGQKIAGTPASAC